MAPKDEEALLSTRERGFALAATRALGTHRAEVLCGRRSAALRRYVAQLHGSQRLAEEAELNRPLPEGLARVDPSWYTAPPPSTRPDAERYLARRAYGHLVAMPTTRTGHLLDELEQRTAAELRTLLFALGRRRIAIAFSGAPRNALAQLCTSLGEPAATSLLREVHRAGSLSSDEVKTAQRALFRRSQAVEAADFFFLRTGAGWLGPALAARGGDRVQRVAQRMVREEGLVLLRESTLPATESELASALRTIATALSNLDGVKR